MQNGQSAADPATVFAALAEIVYGGAEPSEAYAAICVAATMLVPGCDHASLMLREGRAYVTVGASDAVARHVDDLERATGEGPCLDAIEEEAAQIEPDLSVSEQWPHLAPGVVKQTPVRGAMGFRLRVDDRKVGSLNLFSDTPGAFDLAAAANGTVLAAFAAVCVVAVSRGEDVASLRNGIESNREIGKAIGLLMALNKISDDEAFDLLRRTSQQVNVKVAELARTVVDQHRREIKGSS
ncbi:GAF and ANTAR domain-containing protein [Rhodococcus aetherivorans]